MSRRKPAAPPPQQQPSAPSESQQIIAQEELDTARERSLHDAAMHEGRAGDEAASQLIGRLVAIDARHERNAAIAAEAQDALDQAASGAECTTGQQPPAPSESQRIIELEELDTAHERSLHDAAMQEGQAGDEAACQLIGRLVAIDAQHERNAAIAAEAQDVQDRDGGGSGAAAVAQPRGVLRQRRERTEAAARARRRARFGSDGFGGTVGGGADSTAAARAAKRQASVRTQQQPPPVQRRDVAMAEARQAAGAPAPLDEVILSHAVSRGVASEDALKRPDEANGRRESQGEPQGTARSRTPSPASDDGSERRSHKKPDMARARCEAPNGTPRRAEGRCAPPALCPSARPRGSPLTAQESSVSHEAHISGPRPSPVSRTRPRGPNEEPDEANERCDAPTEAPLLADERCAAPHATPKGGPRGSHPDARETRTSREAHVSGSRPSPLSRTRTRGPQTQPEAAAERRDALTIAPTDGIGGTPPTTDADGNKPPQHARRPPAALTSDALAAQVRLGLQSAGLAWLQQASAADAAHSTAAPAERPPAQEPHGRADADVPLIGEPPRHEREIALPVPADFEWPLFAFICFYEHTGEEREANSRALGGAPTCSVADRRSVLPPSPGTLHVIGQVRDFLDVYPHSIPRQSNHVTCGHANWASWRSWEAKILDGSMRQSAEEILFINSIGDRSIGEQPPTAHQHILGPPTFVVNGHDFAAPSKTYFKWARNLPPIAPTLTLPVEQRWSELAVSGSSEVKTVKRSYTPRNMAEEEARVYATVEGGDTSEFGRPANQPCKAYGAWRRQLAHAFGLFAAHYAPTLSTAWLASSERAPAIVLVPLAQSSAGVCAMVNLHGADNVYGVERDPRRGGAEQGEEASAFLTGGIETQYAAPLKQYGHDDCVVILPWSAQPTWVATSAAQRDEARKAGLSAAWCTLPALQGHAMCQPVGLAFQRVAALNSEGTHGAQQPGVWVHALPLVRARTARAWAQAADEAPLDNASAREAFMAAEAARGVELRACLLALETGDGMLAEIADSVKTAADYDAEIPFPSNGLPDFSSSTLRLQPFVERPLALATSWFARLPPQQVPPGFRPLPWQGILRRWARRDICKSLNKTADRDFDAWRTQCGSSLPRPRYVCIGRGGAKDIPHADGVGSYNALTIVWEYDEASGLFDKMDYQRPGRTHWVLNVLRRLLGEHDDQQLMALIMEGVRWGIEAPMQIRIAPNLERLDTRIRGVGAAFNKLLKKGLYYKYKKLRRAHEALTPDGPCPFIIIPPYVVGTGGTDKPDNPDEKRIVGDAGAPHPEQEVRERNHPHEEPSGPVQMSINDMMGPPPGTTPKGQRLDASRYPMPDPETKPRPRHVYNDKSVLQHMAWVNGTYLAGIKSDGRHMFFQFELAPEAERTCCFVVIVELAVVNDNGTPVLDANGEPMLELWFILIVATCMNMGSRNASKMAQRFTDRLLEGFALLLDKYVRDTWLPKQTPALQALIAERSEKMGPRQARPFTTSGYTDDYEHTFVGPELFAAGSFIWRIMCDKANYWLSAKEGAGTVIDYIGGRLVLNGGYGCLPPTKHARAVADSTAAIEGRITREDLESHNSFLVHVHDWLDFPEGTLKGLSAPLKMPGSPEQIATVNGHVREQHIAIVQLLHSRDAASFWSGIDESARIGGSPTDLATLRFAPRLTSDACSDVERPHICCVANGLYFRYPLEGAWRRRHITLTETCGTQLGKIVFPRYFPRGELMVEGDATTALAAALGRAAAADIIYARRRADQIPAVRDANLRAWVTHCKGWANGLSDAGSRDKMPEMRALADAFGIRLREVPIPREAHEYMRDVLANTSDVEPAEAQHSTAMGTQNLNMIGNMPVAHPGEGGAASAQRLPPLGEGQSESQRGQRFYVMYADRDNGHPGFAQSRLHLLDLPAVQIRVPSPRPIGWEDSDDDVKNEDEVEERCAQCYHRYFPVHTCRCVTPLLLDASMRRWRKLRVMARVAGTLRLWHARAAERVYAPAGAGYEEARLRWEASAGQKRPRPAEGRGPAPERTTGDTHLAGTAIGTHNINMTGSPIAHSETLVRLTRLSEALQSGEGAVEVTRLVYEVGAHLGSRRIRSGTVQCIIAACRRLMQPSAFTTEGAAAAGGCDPVHTRRWIRDLTRAIQSEGGQLPAQQAGGAGAGGAAGAASTSGAGASAGDTAACSAEETGALGALLMLADNEEQAGAAASGPQGPPPPSAPPSPPEALSIEEAIEWYNADEAAAEPRQPPPPALPASLLQPAAVLDADELVEWYEATSEAAMVRNLADALGPAPHPSWRPQPIPETGERRQVLDFVFGQMVRETTAAGGVRYTPMIDVDARPPARLTPPPMSPRTPATPLRHSTSVGRHNLNLMGDMPIAHGGEDAAGSPEPLRGRRSARRPTHALQRCSPTLWSVAALAQPQPRRPRQAGARPSPVEAVIASIGSRKGRADNGKRHAGDASPAMSPDVAPLARPKAARFAPRPLATPTAQALAPTMSPPPEGLASGRAQRIIRCDASTELIDDEIAAARSTRSRSPQPATAADARRRAAAETAETLQHHDSKYALFRDQPGALHELVIDAAAARDAGIPHGTASADEWGFKWVRRFCEKTHNPWMRPRAVATVVDELCEVWFTIMALVWITQMMAPSARRLAEGYGQGKPTSGLLAIYAYRRVMRDCNRYVPEMAGTLRVLKGICARYKLRWGDDAFVVTRKQPFATAHIAAIMTALTSVAGLLQWPQVLRAAITTAFCYAMSTGARKDEWTLSFQGDTFVRRSNFAWVDEAGNDLPSTAAVIASRRNGHMLRGRSAPSKCDRLNVEWGSRDMWFKYDDSQQLNFAWRWQQWELAHPCPTGERQRWPAFSPTGGATPFTGGHADACLKELLALVMPAAEAAKRSWHSARVTIATRLYARRGNARTGIARDEIEGVIQAIVRWKTPEAMRLYARMEPGRYAEYVAMATDLSLASDGTLPEGLPEVDPAAVLPEMQGAVAAIESEAANAKRAARPARAENDAAAPGDGKQKQRRAAPSTGAPRSGVAEPTRPAQVFDIGDGQAVSHAGEESWQVVGQKLMLHNSFWQHDADEYSECRVVGYIGKYKFQGAATAARYTYVIECEGHHYPAPHTTVAGALMDAAVKRRVRKAPAPRLL